MGNILLIYKWRHYHWDLMHIKSCESFLLLWKYSIASYRIGVALFSCKALQQNQINVKKGVTYQKKDLLYISKPPFLYY